MNAAETFSTPPHPAPCACAVCCAVRRAQSDAYNAGFHAGRAVQPAAQRAARYSAPLCCGFDMQWSTLDECWVCNACEATHHPDPL